MEKHNQVAKNISNLRYPSWDGLFPFGYAVFSYSIDGKLKIFPKYVNNSEYLINWDSFKIVDKSDTKIKVLIPDVTDLKNKINYYSNTTLISKLYNSINKYYPSFQLPMATINFVSGIIVNNENGIIGFISVVENKGSIIEKPILEYMALK